MILWRVSNHSTLDGSGVLNASGRWHMQGRGILYCTPNPATALLEVLVHATIDLEDMPVDFRYLEIEAPEAMSTSTVDVKALGRNWEERELATRRAGDEWLISGRAALLMVPSVIVPATWNTLINPQHPECVHLRVIRIHQQKIDVRLVR